MKESTSREVDLLDQGKILADQFDKEKPEPKKESKVQAAPTPSNDTNLDLGSDDSLIADQNITTDQLEEQAAKLVKQANIVMAQQSAESSTDATADTSAQTVQQGESTEGSNAKEEIASLLGRLQELTGQPQADQPPQ